MFIIITIGRTGSCLLVNILNKFKDVTCTGEIYNIQYLEKLNRNDLITINDLRILNDKNNINRGRRESQPNFIPKNTNYHKYFQKSFDFMKEYNKRKTILEQLEYIMPDSKISGCKMLGNSSALKLFLSLTNIRKHFKIILLIREDTEKLRASMKRASFPSWNTVNLEKENSEYKKIYQENKDIYLISYEDILKRNNNLKGLFKFINVVYSDNLVIKGLKTICSYANCNNKKLIK